MGTETDAGPKKPSYETLEYLVARNRDEASFVQKDRRWWIYCAMYYAVLGLAIHILHPSGIVVIGAWFGGYVALHFLRLSAGVDLPY